VLVLAIIGAVVWICLWRPAKEPPASPAPSPERAGPRHRPICGGIALLCGVLGLFCFAAGFLHKDAALSFFGVSLLLVTPTLGFALFGFLRGEQPAWPAVVGGVFGPLPVIILISGSIYEHHLQPAVDRLRHAHPYASGSTTASPNSPKTPETPPLGKPANAAGTSRNTASGAAATGRSSAEARARWSGEAQAAVESWLRSDTNGLFTPRFGKFVKLQGSGYVWPPVWNIQGYDYITLHRTAQFTEGTIPVVIYVTEGAITAPGQTSVGTPVLEGLVSPAQGAHIRVSHPEVGKGVKPQDEPAIGAAQPSPQTIEEFDDGIIKRRQFEQAVERWGGDGMAAIEAFLNNGTNEISDLCGKFVCFQNEGYPKYSLFTTKDPSGNGTYWQINVQVRALFSGGYLPVNIQITEGRVTAPALSTVGIPTIQGRIDLHSGATLGVAHPQLCSFEQFQGQDNLKFLLAEGEAKLIGTYNLRSPVSASNQPCKLELRPDHSLTLSNCPTPGDPQRLVTLPGEWSLSVYRGVGILFLLSVSGGDAVTLRNATCNLVYPPAPGAFRAMVHLACRDVSGSQKELAFVAEESIPSPFMPRDNPHFVRRQPTGNPPNWDTPIANNPETQLRSAINYRLKTYANADVAMERARLAEMLHQRGALTEAETEAREALAGLRKRFGDQTIYVPNALHTLAQVLQAQGRLPEAESVIREELALKQKMWHPREPRVVQTASNLNQVLRLQGKPTE